MSYIKTYQEAIDFESELRGLTRSNSKCPQHKYQGRVVTKRCPNKNCHCLIRGPGNCKCQKCNKKDVLTFDKYFTSSM